MPTRHITLSGRNDSDARSVFVEGLEDPIGEVRRNGWDLWSAYDAHGRNHGDWYTSDWNAAKQLQLGLRLV